MVKHEEDVSVKDQFDMVFSEYQVGLEHTKRYADYANLILTISYIIIGAMLFWLSQEKDLAAYYLICLYVIPIFVYLMGLMYVHTLHMIGKTESYMLNLEACLISFTKKNSVNPFIGWNTFLSQEKNTFYYFVYGFLFLLFWLFPLVSIILLGNMRVIYTGEMNFEEIAWSWIFTCFIPLTLYLLYFCIGLFLSILNIKIRQNPSKFKRKKT